MFNGGGRAALGLGATIAAVMLFGPVCSVDDAGLSGGPGSAGASGSAGVKGTGGNGGHAGTRSGGGAGGVIGTGGNATGGRGTGGVIGTGGNATGGIIGTGGVIGTGGNATGGTTGTGGGTGGNVGTGGSATGGAGGMDGIAGSGGGTAGAGGNATGGAIGTGGTGGMAGSGGTAGMGGRGGAGGRPASCASFPSGSSLTTPTDNRLHCYWVHGNQIDWTSAETVCENEGGTLVTILSSMENMAVLRLAMQANLFAGAGAQVFIGATDDKALDDQSGAGDYAWVTGETWSYENWHGGQPDGACVSCGGAGFGCACDHRGAIAMDGTWYDRTESTSRPFVCEALAK